MVSILFYLLMGLVQGILEWLPVSSEGQLVLLSLWFSSTSVDDALTLAFWLHLGTMFAVLIYYREQWAVILDPSDKSLTPERQLLIFSTLGTAIIGVPIKFLLLDAYNWTNLAQIFMMIIGISLIITGYLIGYSRTKAGVHSLEDLSISDYFLIGIAQGFAIIPGISRSGTTISTFLLLKTGPKDSFRGSFLISVPAALGAVILDILSSLLSGQSLIGGLDRFGILLAILLALITGYLTIDYLIKIVESYDFSVVAYFLGALIILVSVVTLIA